MRIYIGSDHAGFGLKQVLAEHLQEQGYEVQDLGVYSEASADYPDVAHQVAQRVAQDPKASGVLICGTGIGVCITANKHPGIRAAHACEPVSARLAREHNDANIVCLGARIVGTELAKAIVETFLGTPFSHDERHLRRIHKIELPGGETSSHTV